MNVSGTIAPALDANSLRSGFEPELFGIGDMARAYGVSLRALRFYEDRDLMRPIRNGTTRLYDARARLRLQLILKGKQLGFTLAEIREMLRVRGADEVSPFELALEPEQVLSQISLLQRQREALDCAIEELKETHARLAAAARTNDEAQRAAKAG